MVIYTAVFVKSISSPDANLDNKKVKMSRKIRSIFPRGKRFDRIAKDCIAVPKDLQDE